MPCYPQGKPFLLFCGHLFPKQLQDFAGFTGLSRIHNSIANLGKGKGIIMNNHEYIFVASIIDFDDDSYKLFLEHI